jgi:hypothetical protein
MAVRVDERVARCLTLLKSQEFNPLIEFLQLTHADTLQRLSESKDKDEMCRLQGRALQVKEILDLVSESTTLLTKLRGR